MDRLKKKEMKKIRKWLSNYIPEPIRKSVGGFKDKIVSLFKTNTSVRERKETKQIKKPLFILKKKLKVE